MSCLSPNNGCETLLNGESGGFGRNSKENTPIIANPGDMSEKASSSPKNIRLPRDTESEERKLWFEEFYKGVRVEEFLPLATAARDDGKFSCRFGGRAVGAYNVVIFIVFDDGVEWCVKVPKRRTLNGSENDFLMSEYATLLFLQKIGNVPVPKVHGFSFDHKNPAKTPYFFMDKIPGSSFYDALHNSLNKAQIYNILQELARVKKTLMQHPFDEIGSLSIMDNETCQYDVDRHLTIWDYRTIMEGEEGLMGPYQSSFQYYANLLHLGWSEWHDSNFFFVEPDVIREQWNIHTFLCSILTSYVGNDGNRFFLAHTDLSFANIMVDEEGSITGIIDWEFASTLPLQAAEHYPLFFTDEEKFIDIMGGIYDDPRSELRDWKEFYAKQFDGDSAMEDYFKNINSTIAFEKVLRDNSEATIENLVEKFKFLESASTLDQIGLQFPWTKPTSARLDNGQSLRREIAVQTKIPPTPLKTPSICLSSESISLNDMIYRPSRFERFIVSSRRRIEKISGKIKDGFSILWGICMCRKRGEFHDIEMI